MTVENLFTSSLAADVILLVMLLELVALTILYQRIGRGIPPLDLLLALVQVPGWHWRFAVRWLGRTLLG